MNMRIEAVPIAKPKAGAVKNKAKVALGAMSKQLSASNISSRSPDLLIQITGVRSGNLHSIQTKIRQGLTYKAFTTLEKALDMPQKELADVLQIPISTLRRRKEANRLHMDESDRIVRYARIKEAALDMMQGDNSAAIKWLHSPLELLSNESPLDHANTEMGARDVEDLITRIRHGVFS